MPVSSLVGHKRVGHSLVTEGCVQFLHLGGRGLHAACETLTGLADAVDNYAHEAGDHAESQHADTPQNNQYNLDARARILVAVSPRLSRPWSVVIVVVVVAHDRPLLKVDTTILAKESSRCRFSGDSYDMSIHSERIFHAASLAVDHRRCCTCMPRHHRADGDASAARRRRSGAGVKRPASKRLCLLSRFQTENWTTRPGKTFPGPTTSWTSRAAGNPSRGFARG